MPDISKINNVAVADISKLDAVTFAHGQKVNNQDVSLVTDAHVLISTHTVPDDYGPGVTSSIDITSGIDSTYDVYEFVFTNIHPSALQEFSFQVDTGTNTSYNQPITSTFFEAAHAEDDGGTPAVFYEGNHDQANADEVFQHLSSNFQSASNDSSLSGSMTLFDPSSSTYVKHFMATTSYFQQDPAAMVAHTAGYVNTTTALTRIRFKMDSGNIDAGVIKMYGLAKS